MEIKLLDASSGEYILLREVLSFIACYAATLLLFLWALSGPSPETESQGDSGSISTSLRASNFYT